MCHEHFTYFAEGMPPISSDNENYIILSCMEHSIATKIQLTITDLLTMIMVLLQMQSVDVSTLIYNRKSVHIEQLHLVLIF
jgi:hypothetical protein